MASWLNPQKASAPLQAFFPRPPGRRNPVARCEPSARRSAESHGVRHVVALRRSHRLERRHRQTRTGRRLVAAPLVRHPWASASFHETEGVQRGKSQEICQARIW